MINEFKDGIFRDMWADYSARVIPEAAGPVQRQSMQQSFLAGALAYQMCMGAAFANDATDGKAINNLQTLDAEISAMAVEHMQASTDHVLDAIGDAIKPDDDGPMKTRVHIVEARGLSASDVDELNEIINQYISVKTATRAEH